MSPRHHVTTPPVIKDLFLCVLSSVLLIFSFPNFNLWIFAWFGFVPLFFALEKKSKVRAFLLSYITGVIFWTGIVYWLIHVTLLGTILLILYLALYFAVFGLIASSAKLRETPPSVNQILFLPAIWVLLEYLRNYLFTGLSWALLGYSQSVNLAVIQIADITGAWGVSFLVMMANVMVYSVVSRKSSVVSLRREYLLPVLCLSVTLIYGYFKILHFRLTTYDLPLKVSVIQGNIPQELKWNPQAESYILDKFAQLTEQAAFDKPDLIVWPEASSPDILGEDKLVLQGIFVLNKKINSALLIGAVICDNERYFNSALLIKDDRILGQYDKLHLVPFGEYIPLKKVLPFLETIVPIGDITAGREYTLFQIPRYPDTQIPVNFSVLICFEDLFPELSREFVRIGANFLVNITNDAWYKKTSAPYQHFQASIFRAVENRVFLIRCANTGVSGFISPSGKIISLVSDELGRNIFIDGYKTETLPIIKRSLSFYTRYGDVFILLLCIFVLYSIFRFARSR